MTKQPDLFDQRVPDGWPGALQGMKVAIDHAEDQAPGWGDRAFLFLKLYLHRVRPVQFIAPDVRGWCEREGMDAPPNNRAWGGVFRRARHAGLIERDGFAHHGDDITHTHPVSQWRPK